MIEHLDEKIMKMTYLAILTPRLDVKIDIMYHIHMERNKKYFYYFSFAQSISIGSKVERSAKRTKFQQTQPHHTSTSYPMTCTSTLDVILMWKDFENFYTFIDYIEPLKTYAIETYPDLAIFSFLGLCLRKTKAYHLLGQDVIPQLLGG
jgi:hypothetical protein